jgi:hypothetical protein
MMNSVDMANDLIFRARNLNEFTITTEVPDDFRFNGVVPFDMQIKDSIITAKVWAVDFDEAAKRLDDFLGTCK